MADGLLDLDGFVVPMESLGIERARATASALARGTFEYARLLECRRRAEGNEEIVVLEVDIQRPQRRAHDIRSKEPIAIVFFADDRRPDVLSIRGDFPQVPHLNLTAAEFPKSLCLYDQDWLELKARWTPARFVERIRFWLAETARGVLHRDDQPLEPLIVSSGYQIVIPHDLLTAARANPVQPLIVRLAGDDKKSNVLLATRPTGGETRGVEFVAVAVATEPQTHGVIRSAPGTLHELHQFLVDGGCDLLAQLRTSTELWANAATLKGRLIVIALCPKRRGLASTVEATDVWGFLTFKTVEEVLAAIGRRAQGGGYILGDAKGDEQGQQVPIEVLRTTFAFSRELAASLNGWDAAVDLKVVAIGLGALGSKVQLSLARAAFGRWTLVDEDVLLPHNLARHQYDGAWVGFKKAEVARALTVSLFSDEPPPEAITANVLRPAEAPEKLSNALSEAELILDMSASVTVARHLATSASTARRVSLFLNPNGTQLVLLAEDKDRGVALDDLEFQLYRALLTQPKLEDHLVVGAGRVRYAASCRDITSRLPDDQVSLLAAIGARAVRTVVADRSARIRVWKLDPDTFHVTSIEIPVAATSQQDFTGWTLIVDEELTTKLRTLRESKLPNETGGVLLGFFDHEARRAYVVDTISSPPDSQEWPTLYIRGSERLRDELDRVTTLTAGNIEYIGEWHSHPRGCSCKPSADDIEVFGWLTSHMADEGQPALMAIVGDQGPSFFLGQMIWEEGPESLG